MTRVCDHVRVTLKANIKTGIRFLTSFSSKVEASHIETENIASKTLDDNAAKTLYEMLLNPSFFFFRALLERHWLAQAIFKLTIAADLCARHILVCYVVVVVYFLGDWPSV